MTKEQPFSATFKLEKETKNAVRYAEAFEICEYGTRPDQAMIRKLFPFLPK